MYHCSTRFYFAGQPCKEFDILRGLPPLECFTHEFTQSTEADALMASEADVILAIPPAADARKFLRTLLEAKKQGAQLILLAEGGQDALWSDFLPEISDIWTCPLSEAELRFRFTRWQQTFKTEKDLWQARHFLDAAINSVPNLIWFKRRDGIHEMVNDSFCKSVGKTRQQVEGRGHAYIWDVDAEDPACIESDLGVMNSGKTCVSEEFIQTGEGDRLLTTYKSPLYDVDGSVMGTVGVAIDITQERAYEREITQKNQTLERLFTTIDCGMMCHTLDGSRIISINRAALEILGYETLDEMMEDGFSMIATSVIEEDRPILRHSISTLKGINDNVNVEYRVRHKDGKLIHVMGNIKLVQQNGELFYQRFLLDITARKLEEERKHAETERLQMELIHALSMDYCLVCFFDLDTGIVMPLRCDDDTGDAFASIFNGELSFKDSMENYIQSSVYSDDCNMLRLACSPEELQYELSKRETYYVNYRAVSDGEIKFFQIKAVRAGTWDGRRGIVLGFRNVDDETRMELEKKSLLEDALFQANRANRAKSTFLSNMSHDIRTPMNAIVGFTNLAITHIDNRERVEEYLKKILTSGNHLVSLINDVLDMSRIESGKMHLDETPCSLPDILHGLSSIVQADIRAKQLDFYIDTINVLDEDIYCDKLRLNQILLNILSNSIKYTPHGGSISMRITELPGAPEGFANYRFQIKDTGIGMSEDFVSHIFEPFERERNSTISGIQGTGLGMAITKNIVDMMHGSIEVKSEQNVGTEFIVSLTLRLRSDVKEVPVIPMLKDCRALVVDDDFNTCDSVSYMLQQIGLRAEWTLSGKEAILRTRQAIMRGDDYRIYVIDWLMPDMNGIEVVRRIRKESDANAPIIVLTAYDWTDIEEEAREAGVTAFCSKPLFLSEFRNCLNSIVGKTDTAAEAVMPSAHYTGRILLVEDNELNQEIASAILEEAGFDVEIADNGSIAIEMITSSGPGYYRLVLMDVQMPVMDGYTATRAIRGLDNAQLASIPIIAMTANAFEEDRRQAIACGMNGHVAKPINIEKLLETLNNILD